MGFLRHTIFAALALLAFGPAFGAPLRVGVIESPPFVISENGLWTGYSIDIWQKVAELNTWEYKTVAYPDPAAVMSALGRGEVDIIAADVPITSDGIQQADFSQPYFLSGLQIMVTSARPHSFSRVMENLRDWEHLPILWAVIGAVAVLTVIVTLFERVHNPEFPKTWHDGLAEAFYYVISLALTGKSAYKGFPGVLGRLMLVVWMILGVVTVVFLTSSVTTTLANEKNKSKIAGPQDLQDKKVGVVKESRAMNYLVRHGINRIVYPTLGDAVNALLKEDVQAIVGAAPLLQYYDNSHPQLPITEVGEVFSRYTYGFAMQRNSPLRQPLDNALLQLQEDGALREIGQKYFGQVFVP